MLGIEIKNVEITAFFLILGEKAVVPVQLKELDADLTSQFVFSPPVLRSRKKQVSSISRIVEELVSVTFYPFHTIYRSEQSRPCFQC